MTSTVNFTGSTDRIGGKKVDVRGKQVVPPNSSLPAHVSRHFPIVEKNGKRYVNIDGAEVEVVTLQSKDISTKYQEAQAETATKKDEPTVELRRHLSDKLVERLAVSEAIRYDTPITDEQRKDLENAWNKLNGKVIVLEDGTTIKPKPTVELRGSQVLGTGYKKPLSSFDANTFKSEYQQKIEPDVITDQLLSDISNAVRSSFHTTDDEVDSIVNEWVARHVDKLRSLPTHLDRVRYSVNACKRRYTDYMRAETTRKRHEGRAGGGLRAVAQENIDAAMVDELHVYGVSPSDEQATEELLDGLAYDELDVVLDEANRERKVA